MVQQLPRRRRLRPLSFHLQILGLCTCASLLVISVADAQTPCPNVTNVHPPSGSLTTEFTISGENLDQTTLSVTQNSKDILETVNITESAIVFTLNREATRNPATVLLVPDQVGCSNFSVELFIYRLGKGELRLLLYTTAYVNNNYNAICIPQIACVHTLYPNLKLV